MENRHPGQYVQQELTKRGRTQKGFAHILGKKVSEVNELIKGKRNITVQRDILLSTVFDTEPKKWIALQMEYDYQIGSQSVDQEKIEEIKVRKSLFEEKDGSPSGCGELKPSAVESGEVENGKLKIEDGELRIEDGKLRIENGDNETIQHFDSETIPQSPVASEKEATTIQATEPPQKVKSDKKKEHEIFRNF